MKYLRRDLDVIKKNEREGGGRERGGTNMNFWRVENLSDTQYGNHPPRDKFEVSNSN